MPEQNDSKFFQLELPLEVVASADLNGLEMGVTSDGTPFLTASGLARACGVPNQYFSGKKGSTFFRSKIAKSAARFGFEGCTFSRKIKYKGQTVNAIPSIICSLTIKHFAKTHQEASDSLDVLLMNGLGQFIYDNTGYTPNSTSHDPVDTDRVNYRDRVKDSHFLLTDEIKEFLIELDLYYDNNKGVNPKTEKPYTRRDSAKHFSEAMDALNISITGRTAKQLKELLAKQGENPYKKGANLVRDYFPADTLAEYIVVIRGAAAIMRNERELGLVWNSVDPDRDCYHDGRDAVIASATFNDVTAVLPNFKNHIKLERLKLKQLEKGHTPSNKGLRSHKKARRSN